MKSRMSTRLEDVAAVVVCVFLLLAGRSNFGISLVAGLLILFSLAIVSLRQNLDRNAWRLMSSRTIWAIRAAALGVLVMLYFSSPTGGVFLLVSALFTLLYLGSERAVWRHRKRTFIGQNT